VAQVIVITLVVLLGGPDSYNQPPIWVSMLIVMALPVVPTVASVLATRPVVRALWIVVALGAALLFAGEARGLLWDAFLLYIMVPAVIFVLFNLRFWRATAPVVMVLSLGGSLGWLTFLEIGKAIWARAQPAASSACLGWPWACCWRCRPRAASAGYTGPSAPASRCCSSIPGGRCSPPSRPLSW
jgi:hypothetical protein